MRKFLLALAMQLLTGSAALAQSTMTDEQVISFIMEEKEKGTSQTEIVTKLMQRGIDIQQIQRIKRKYERQIQQSGMGSVADEAINNANNRLRTNNGQQRTNGQRTTNGQQRTTGSGSQMIRQQATTKNEDDPTFLMMQAELGGIMPVDSIALLEQLLEQQEKEKTRIFGHDIFNNEALSFEPNMNIATPADYRLGPGDAVAVEIYGASQQSIDATITPDGYITIDGFGPVQISGLTVAQANARLRSQLSSRYADSQIRLSVGQTRTILVNVMGEVNYPGTYTLSAFSTVNTAMSSGR